MPGRDIISIGIKNKDINNKTIDLEIISIFFRLEKLLSSFSFSSFSMVETGGKKASIISITSIAGRKLKLIYLLYNTC